jgi:glucose-6-phosphate isomerase
MHLKQDFPNWDEDLLIGSIGRFWESAEISKLKDDDTFLPNWLGWSLGCDWTSAEKRQYLELATEIYQEDFHYILLIGVGGSSVGARAIVSLGENLPKFIFADSVVPSVVKKILAEVGNQKTLLVISSKSGTTLETITLANYFLDKLGNSQGSLKCKKNVIAITDPGTFLEKLAIKQNFRSIIHGKPDIGGRFSELSSFGLFPALLNKTDISEVIDSANEMASLCRTVILEENAAIPLVEFLLENLRHGRDKLYVYLPESLSKFAMWLEQLLSESLGKDGVGIVPIVGDSDLVSLSTDVCSVMYQDLSMEDESAQILRQHFEDNTIPIFNIEVDKPESLGGEFFRWKMSVVLIASSMNINPFDQPQVQSSKAKTSEMLDYFTNHGKLPPTCPTLTLSEWVAQIKNDSYIAVLPFLQLEDGDQELLFNLAYRIRNLTKRHVTLATGPSYLHSTGQMHKGGPVSGMYLQLFSDNVDEIPIAGEEYGFSTLLAAQANGDMESLVSLNRPVCRVDLGTNIAEGLSNLIVQIETLYLQ